MNFLPSAITLKPSKIAIDRFPRRKIMRQLPPRTTGAHDIQYGIDQLAHVVSARATAPFGFRNQRFDQSPLTIRQIGRVWLPFHTTSSASSPLLKQVLTSYLAWYNEHRPHATLYGKTPNEVYFRLRPANRRPRIEPRESWPRRSPCAAPCTLVAGQPGDRFELEVGSHDGRRHLPIVSLRRAA